MFTVEKMYGVIEGNPRVSVRPSRALINELLNLPSRERVGLHTIEPTERAAGLVIDGKSLKLFDSSDYWREVLEACRDSQLAVTFLDDIKLHRKAIELFFSIQKNQENMQQKQREQQSDIQDRLFKQAIYEAYVKADHAFTTERRDEMVRRIVEVQPRLVVAPQDFGDYFKSDPVDLGSKGVEVGEYLREEVLWNLLRPEEPVRAGLTKIMPPQGLPSLIMPVRLMERQYSAVIQNRIMPEGKPNFIGTWDTICPSAGLFEIYVAREQDDVSYGEIYDTAGEAKFQGILPKNDQNSPIKFWKEYLPERSPGTKEYGPIIYQGRFNQGICRGRFFTASGSLSGEFIMNPGSKLLS